VVHTNNADIVYKIAPRYMLGDTTLMNHHPADSIYRFIWTDERVNPYGTMFDSLKGDIHIPMAGFRLPAPGYVTSQFGWRRYRMHKGTDIKVQVGDSIRAAWGGQVRIVGWDPRGYGYFVVMRHDNGLETVYGHLSRPLVDEYEKVPAGYVIGLGGNTGRSTGSHLHLEIRYLGEAINPENLINFAAGELRNKEEYVIGVNAMKKVRAEQAAMKYHKVRSGDTLSGIARKYGTTVRKLCQLNKIKETKILQIGQKIRVR
jgi:murein DD-endopeptidase MepM/ murein hydrolase activator NlpD